MPPCQPNPNTAKLGTVVDKTIAPQSPESDGLQKDRNSRIVSAEKQHQDYPENHLKLWTIRGNVYDLSKWSKYHPGGSTILDQVRGSDCTALFESYHTFVGTSFQKGGAGSAYRKCSTSMKLPLSSTSSDRIAPQNQNNQIDEESDQLYKMLNKFYVRKATDREMDESAEWDWDHIPKTNKIRARVRHYFVSNNISPKAPYWILILYCCYTALMTTQAWLWLTKGSYLSSILFGLSIWYCSGDFLHMGTHYAIFDHPSYNLVLANFLGWLHNNPLTWIRQHVLGHHVFPNIAGKDPDLYHFEVLNFFSNGVSGWRLTEDTEHRDSFSKWYMGFSFAMSITGLGPSLAETMEYFIHGTLMSPWVIPHKTRLSFKKKIMVFLYWILLLSIIIYVSKKFSFFTAIAPFTIHGVLYYIFSQVSHTNQKSHVPGVRGIHPVNPPKRRKRNSTTALPVRKLEWYEHQFHTSHGDYSVGSIFWCIASLGLNLQTVHHCFPNVHWAHYSALYPILCQEFAVEPSRKGLFQSLAEHFRFLQIMNSSRDSYDTHSNSNNELLADSY